jgi:small subunit ribosomal protein S8
MNHTDPIADMLTRIRNAIMAEHKSVIIPLSKIKREIANVLKREGYIADYRVEKSQFPPRIVVDLKYRSPRDNVITGIKRISKPGRRVFAGVDGIPRVLGGLGIALLSTSKGILTGKECERHNIGGEVLLHIW